MVQRVQQGWLILILLALSSIFVLFFVLVSSSSAQWVASEETVRTKHLYPPAFSSESAKPRHSPDEHSESFSQRADSEDKVPTKHGYTHERVASKPGAQREAGEEAGEGRALLSREPYELAPPQWSPQELRLLLDGHWPWEKDVLGRIATDSDLGDATATTRNSDTKRGGGNGNFGSGAGVQKGKVDGSRAVCERVYQRVRALGSDQLLQWISSQERQCGAFTYDEWQELRLTGAARLAANNNSATSLFLHLEKAAGTMACKLLVGYDRATGEKNTRSSAGNCNEIPWPGNLEYRAAFTGHGLPHTTVPCPDNVVYWTSVRHPWRRLLSTAQNRHVTLGEADKCTGQQQRLLNDYHISMFVSNKIPLQFPCRDGAPLDELLFSEWRWCSLFSGGVYPDELAAESWEVLMRRLFGMSDDTLPHWPSCGEPATRVFNGSTPGGLRLNRCIPAEPVPPIRAVWNLTEEAASASPAREQLRNVAHRNRFDLELWTVMHETAYSRNIFG